MNGFFVSSIFALVSTSYISEIISLASESVVFENTEYDFKLIMCTPVSGNYHLLVTDGLRNHTQEVNEENKAYAQLELYMCLPDYWNIENKDWPIHWLNRIAQVPQKNDTWFGLGDTLPAGNPPSEVDEQFKANHFILFEPEHVTEFHPAKLNQSFNFLAVVPLFQKEIDFKLKNSHSMLRKKFVSANLNERIDIYRDNVCKRKFFGRF